MFRTFWKQNTEHTKSKILIDDQFSDEDNNRSIRVTVKGPEFEFSYDQTSNKFREELHQSEYAEPGVTRILIVGDSYTWGACIDEEQIWVKLLEIGIAETSSNYEIINAGLLGSDTHHEVKLLEELVPKYHPNIVLMVFLPNDMFTNYSYDNPDSKTLDKTVRKIKGRDSSGSIFLHSVRFIQRMLLGSDYMYCRVYLGTYRGEYFTTPMSSHLRKQYEITKELFTLGNEVCQNNNSTFIVVSAPQQFQVLYIANNYKIDGVDPYSFNREFSEHARANNFLWMSTLDYFVDSYKINAQELFFRYDGHFTQEGNNVLANFLLDFRDVLQLTNISCL